VLFANGPNIYAGGGNDGSFTPPVYISEDDAASWQPSSSGIQYSATAFAASGSNVLAGTWGGGVFISTDYGNTWGAVNDGLGNAYISSLAVIDGVLFAGTNNAAVWKRPLSEMTSADGVGLALTLNGSIRVNPNPLVQSANINVTTTESCEAEIMIVNLLGNEVSRLFTGELEAGEHSFSWNASGVVQSTYWCLLRADGRVEQVALSVLR
jgi:hypothetical protein